MIETRYRYEPTEEVPDGWVFMRNQFDDNGFFALYCDSAEYRPDRQSVWITLRQIVQHRTVTEWVDNDF